ncbi:MAG: hypothetical protein PF441_09090 [Desulfuromusa sp.]|nr:hypothetical protein [Desulfuromusa sp.]
MDILLQHWKNPIKYFTLLGDETPKPCRGNDPQFDRQILEFAP